MPMLMHNRLVTLACETAGCWLACCPAGGLLGGSTAWLCAWETMRSDFNDKYVSTSIAAIFEKAHGEVERCKMTWVS